jgi:hypothetical protein
MMTSEWVLSDRHQEGRVKVQAGLTMMVDGVRRTVVNEIRAGALFSVVGVIWGLGDSIIHRNKNLVQNTFEKVKETARWGAVMAWWTVGDDYALDSNSSAPKVRLADFVVSGIGGWQAYHDNKPFDTFSRKTNLIATQLLNQETVAGAHLLADGLVKMALS